MMVGCARIFKFESTLNDCMICMCATVSHMKNRASSMRKNVKKEKRQANTGSAQFAMPSPWRSDHRRKKKTLHDQEPATHSLTKELESSTSTVSPDKDALLRWIFSISAVQQDLSQLDLSLPVLPHLSSPCQVTTVNGGLAR